MSMSLVLCVSTGKPAPKSPASSNSGGTQPSFDFPQNIAQLPSSWPQQPQHQQESKTSSTTSNSTVTNSPGFGTGASPNGAIPTTTSGAGLSSIHPFQPQQQPGPAPQTS